MRFLLSELVVKELVGDFFLGLKVEGSKDILKRMAASVSKRRDESNRQLEGRDGPPSLQKPHLRRNRFDEFSVHALEKVRQ